MTINARLLPSTLYTSKQWYRKFSIHTDILVRHTEGISRSFEGSSELLVLSAVANSYLTNMCTEKGVLANNMYTSLYIDVVISTAGYGTEL